MNCGFLECPLAYFIGYQFTENGENIHSKQTDPSSGSLTSPDYRSTKIDIYPEIFMRMIVGNEILA